MKPSPPSHIFPLFFLLLCACQPSTPHKSTQPTPHKRPAKPSTTKQKPTTHPAKPKKHRTPKPKNPKDYGWYKPKYRARRFPTPKLRLRRLPPPPKTLAVPIDNGSRKHKMIALTFDACSTVYRSRFDRSVARTIINTRTPATIFFGGKWVMDRPKDAKWLASHPFIEVANHAYVHGHLTRRSPKKLRYELLWTQEIIFTILGKIPRYFRPPYVEYNKRVVKAAAKLGLVTIIGDLASGDPDPSFTKKILIKHVLKEARHGSIVVMHINKGGHHTAKALPTIIRKLKQRGFQLVTVGTLLKYAGSLSQTHLHHKPPKQRKTKRRKSKRRKSKRRKS